MTAARWSSEPTSDMSSSKGSALDRCRALDSTSPPLEAKAHRDSGRLTALTRCSLTRQTLALQSFRVNALQPIGTPRCEPPNLWPHAMASSNCSSKSEIDQGEGWPPLPTQLQI